jgi:hypothetical protein
VLMKVVANAAPARMARVVLEKKRMSLSEIFVVWLYPTI